jgi:hypothetical protein
VQQTAGASVNQAEVTVSADRLLQFLLNSTLILSAAACSGARATPQPPAAPTPAESAPVHALPVAELDTLAHAAAADQAPASAILGASLDASSSEPPAGFAIALEASRCYTVLAVGPTGATLEAALYDPHDRRLAIDARPDGHAQLSACTQAAGRHRVEVRLKSGRGEIALRAFAGEAAAPTPRRHKEPAVVAAPPPKDTDPLSLAITQQAQVSAPGTRRINLFKSSGTKRNDRQDWYPKLDAGKCYTFVGVGIGGVRTLSVYLWDPSNKRITDRRAPGTVAIMSACATVDGPYHVQAKMVKGAGDYGIGVYAR